MNMKCFWIIALAMPMAAFAACGDGDASSTTGPQASAGGNGGNGGGTAGNGGTAGAGGEPECAHSGPDVYDPKDEPACPSYVCGGGAHCLPNGLVPAEFHAQLAACNDEMLCVPDVLTKTGGNFIPPTCNAVLGLEGRCLSDCLPQVAAQSSLLTQDSCAEGELCTPCYDPFTQEPTGACVLSCDPGPANPKPEPLPTCCGDDSGTCLPSDVVPDGQADALAKDKCPDAGQVCVPNELLDLTNNPIPCEPDIELQLLGIEDGACLPECVDAVKNIGPGSCPSGYKCAPCDVFGESTGACDDDF